MTYSIVARDSETGDLGVAVQSHWFSVGSVVTWAEPGVGVVATQSFAEPRYGQLGIELMRGGLSAPRALEALVASDEGADRRQVAMVDSGGEGAVHTGQSSIPAFGHVTGDGFCCQANLMERDTVWGAMAEAFAGSPGDLTSRLLAALDAGQEERGDIRGRQSAAVLVVAGQGTGERYKDTLFDVRVDDHSDPLAEIRRLVELARAYARMERAEELAVAGDVEGALAEYTAAERLGAQHSPDNLEFAFWRAAMLASVGREDEAKPIFARLAEADPRWRELLQRLPRAGLLDPDVLVRIN
jgi:uncharacterized Ntn-hydrolase superfamily protein